MDSPKEGERCTCVHGEKARFCVSYSERGVSPFRIVPWDNSIQSVEVSTVWMVGLKFGRHGDEGKASDGIAEKSEDSMHP